MTKSVSHTKALSSVLLKFIRFKEIFICQDLDKNRAIIMDSKWFSCILFTYLIVPDWDDNTVFSLWRFWFQKVSPLSLYELVVSDLLLLILARISPKNWVILILSANNASALRFHCFANLFLFNLAYVLFKGLATKCSNVKFCLEVIDERSFSHEPNLSSYFFNIFIFINYKLFIIVHGKY